MLTWSDYSSYFSTANLVAGFTNKSFPYSSPNDRIEFAKLLKLNHQNIVSPLQIHSNHVLKCTRSGIVHDTDGIIVNDKDLILTIQVADCIPLFLFNEQDQTIGLIHAGWRGIVSGIIENSIRMMKEKNSKFNGIKVLFGPSIRQCCYEIGTDVAKLFDNNFTISGKDGRYHLDMQGVVIDKLIKMNIKSDNINDVNECTYCSNNYHSFRKDGKKAGRMIAIMGWSTGQ